VKLYFYASVQYYADRIRTKKNDQLHTLESCHF